MPTRPMHECPEPGCKVLGYGRCEQHRREADRAHVERVWANRTRLHGTRRWREYSRAFLARHRFCALCQAEGRGDVPATVTDHIQSARRRPDLFWEPANHRPLCHNCNSTRPDEGSFGRR